MELGVCLSVWGHSACKFGIATNQKVVQQFEIISADSALYRWPLLQRGTPTPDFGRVGKNAEIVDRVEHIKVAKHGGECRVH